MHQSVPFVLGFVVKIQTAVREWLRTRRGGGIVEGSAEHLELQHHSAIKIQGLARKRSAWRRVALLATTVYKVFRVANVNATFYENTHSSAKFWTKPKLLWNLEPSRTIAWPTDDMSQQWDCCVCARRPSEWQCCHAACHGGGFCQDCFFLHHGYQAKERPPYPALVSEPPSPRHVAALGSVEDIVMFKAKRALRDGWSLVEDRHYAAPLSTCTECELQIASHLCTTCGDVYCGSCFESVHNRGNLLVYHKFTPTMPICVLCKVRISRGRCAGCESHPSWSTEFKGCGRHASEGYCSMACFFAAHNADWTMWNTPTGFVLPSGDSSDLHLDFRHVFVGKPFTALKYLDAQDVDTAHDREVAEHNASCAEDRRVRRMEYKKSRGWAAVTIQTVRIPFKLLLLLVCQACAQVWVCHCAVLYCAVLCCAVLVPRVGVARGAGKSQAPPWAAPIPHCAPAAVGAHQRQASQPCRERARHVCGEGGLEVRLDGGGPPRPEPRHQGARAAPQPAARAEGEVQAWAAGHRGVHSAGWRLAGHGEQEGKEAEGDGEAASVPRQHSP